MGTEARSRKEGRMQAMKVLISNGIKNVEG